MNIEHLHVGLLFAVNASVNTVNEVEISTTYLSRKNPWYSCIIHANTSLAREAS